ncbi:MAG: helix-turn-helix transcriptional regulator [Anaerolineales bacterium]|jgi:hypothetical protein
MGVWVGDIVFSDWRSLPLANGWSDTFVFPISAGAGLPAGDYAGPLRRMAWQLGSLRPRASLWVPVEAPGGSWYAEELRQSLRGLPLAVAVSDSSDAPPCLQDFSFCPGLFPTPFPRPPAAPDLVTSDLSQQELRALRVLARLGTACTAEVASLVGVSLPTVRRALRGLQSRRLVERQGRETFPSWKIGRRGVSRALRSWGLPPGIPFPGRKERTSAARRHRRTARLWPAWLRRAWPWAEIWTGWSEVRLGRLRPDALAWGELAGRETLFWLEVESGKFSREALKHKMSRRFERAWLYARCFSLPLVFALLAPPWVRRAVVKVFVSVPYEAAVILADWKGFGDLPIPKWGLAQAA